MRLTGVGASTGRACAPLLVYRPAALTATTGSIGLDAALERARGELEALAAGAPGDAAAIVAVQLAFLDDPEWIEPVLARIGDGSAPAAAVEAVSEEVAAGLAALGDEYLRERAADVRDLGTRVLRALAGSPAEELARQVGAREVIVAAHDLSPTDTVGLDPEHVRGIVTEAGGRTSHTAILARGLGIPAVVAVPGLLEGATDGLLAAIDGDAGWVHLPPPPEVEEDYRRTPRRPRAPVTHGPAKTRDGTVVGVHANAGSPDEVARAIEQGADGIGLYRTELLFLERPSVPDEEAQAAVYVAAAEAAGGRPVTFRTLDVGGDKALPALGVAEERNAFLGVRGLRFSLRRPELFAAQLRALGRAAEGRPDVRVMVPMVTTGDELRRARALAAEAGLRGTPFGAMIEVPAAALRARRLCADADFLSVGTNDLTQYVLAVDRTSAALGDLYDDLHPAVLGVLAAVAADAAAAGRTACVCGELAARPGAAVLLAGLGFRELSVAAAAVPAAKAELAAVTIGEARALARRALATEDGAEVEALLPRP